ncbi:MAG: AlwI family type II restriction endonuclease [Clostridia bacterium]|nr:AlwI family type II restriction endonuclease [Clostridia bacterium]MDD4387019.1 AlwI family type II restriction endonuclease [Clostridia bacterium]
MLHDIKFKSYCWSIGTTSFRVSNLNFKIEKQLQMLKSLWTENPTANWSGNVNMQSIYYDLMKETKFVTGEADNKPKDARQKTSGLVEIGVIDSGRRITKVGEKIIDIIQNEDFKSDNIFNINKDSYIYLKQLLKMQKNDNSFKVKPFIILVYLLSKLNYLTREEFTYILPLCTKNSDVKTMEFFIKELRQKRTTIEEIIEEKMLSSDNYLAIKKYIRSNAINTIEDFALIDMGRKGTKYITDEYDFFNSLYDIITKDFTNSSFNTIKDFIKKETKKNPKVARYWKEYLKFNIRLTFEEYKNGLSDIPIFCTKNKNEYSEEFLKVLHTAKWKSTLEDYADLNKRYFSLSDIIIFQDNKIELDLFPKYFFANISEQLLNTEFLEKNYGQFMENDIKLEEIYECLNLDIDKVVKQIKVDYPGHDITSQNISTFIADERLKKFNTLIDDKFKDNDLVELLKLVEKDNRNEINAYVEWEAELPTIFEYLLAIAWYKVSNREGNILEYMKLSLDANLFPKTHAGGGKADIVYEYKNNISYPEHNMLLEATLSESTNQRRMEMEPVSRHLMREVQENTNDNTYCVFITNYLHEEVSSDFRSRRTYNYRVNENVRVGLKIICMQVSDLITIIDKQIRYNNLYSLFENAYKDKEINDLDWYKIMIKEKINEL